MIFISYRRADALQAIGRIRERLADRYGAENVFLDLCDIATGARFIEVIHEALAHSDVALVVIGPRWADTQNMPRLFDPADVVRREIECALAHGFTTVPVLLDRAPMPTAEQIPPSLHPLRDLNAASLESGVDFELGIERLMRRIDEVSAAAAERRGVLTLAGGPWQALPAPTAEAVSALARSHTDPGRIFASALVARRILRSDADAARWIAYAMLPADEGARCLAVSGERQRTIVWAGMTRRLLQYHQAAFAWRDTPYFDALGERAVRWIAVSPSDPAHLLVGTGSYSSGTSAGVATAAGSSDTAFAALGEAHWQADVGYGDLHGTRDGGATWRTGPFRNVNRVLFAEADSRSIYVATADDGLFLSANGGASFEHAPGTQKETILSAAVSPCIPSTVMLGTQARGALVSSDAGQTWSRPAGLDGASVLCAAFTAGAMLLAGTDRGLFVSADGGRTFAPSNRGLVHQRVLAVLSLESEGAVIATDGGGLYARATPGHEWRPVHRGSKRAGIGALAFDADDVLYVGAEGTLWRSEDLGRSFQPLHQVLDTIRAVCVFESAVAESGAGPAVRWNRHDVCLVGTEHGGIHRSGDYGATWERVLHASGSVRKIARCAADPIAVFAVVQGRELYLSRDDGCTWRALDTRRYAPVTFAILEDRPGAILMGTFADGVLQSDDAGASWRAVAGGLPARPVLSLDATVVAGCRRLLAGVQEGGVWRFEEGAKRWRAGRGSIGKESVNDILVRVDRVTVATDTGVFRSADGGATWANDSDGLLNVRQVNRLASSSDGRAVFCAEIGGLYGRLADY